MSKERKPKKALSTLTGRLALFMALLWLVCMVLVTENTAVQIETMTHVIHTDVIRGVTFSKSYPDGSRYEVALKTDTRLYSKLLLDHYYNSKSERYQHYGTPFQIAAAVLDKDGNLITHSGDAIVGRTSSGPSPYLIADLDPEYYVKHPGEVYPFWSELTLYGDWENGIFIPVAVDCHHYLGNLIRLYEVPGADLSKAQKVYMGSSDFLPYAAGGKVMRRGLSSQSLLDLLLHYQSEDHRETGYMDEIYYTNSLFDTIFWHRTSVTTHEGEDLIFAFAIRTQPVLAAMERLRWIYLGTFGFAVLLTLLLRRTMKRRLIMPLRELNYKMSQNWTTPPLVTKNRRYFEEINKLAEHYENNQKYRYRSEKELDRLNKALDYAKEAEENRRQMTSAIAHELKTPLAVIHSYTEGLQERINEEKREHYLSVIQAEVQRMDGMVLEMLDLSRLEAGKVKLAQDQFSLCDLTRNTFDRLKLAVEAKELKVTFDFRCDGRVTADEGRMEQVITNLATNAVKYARFGGDITVKLQTIDGKARFTMENDCDPLPQEVLARLWDTFYRADTARSGEGTGLGLAISKSIIELHGGRVTAYNTLKGVAFSFVI